MSAGATRTIKSAPRARAFLIPLRAALLALVALAPTVRALADDPDTLAIHADVSRVLLGNGTGVIVGVVDSGEDSLHPTLLDSMGNSRMVAAQSFVPGDPSTDDGACLPTSATAPPSPARSSAPTPSTPASLPAPNTSTPASSTPATSSPTTRSSCKASISPSPAAQQILNLSLNFPGANTNGSDRLDLMLDWAAGQGVNISVAAGNINAHRDSVTGEVVLDENPPLPVRSPASAYNVMAVGRTGVPTGGDPLGPITPTLNYNQVFITSRSGPVFSQDTGQVRDKPDIVAPGTNIMLANNNWETQGLWTTGQNGTSVSAALISGMMAQEIGYGVAHNLSTNPMVIKATMLNSADKVLDKDGTPWHPNSSSMVGGILQVTSPMDLDSGTGQVDGARLATQYMAGQQGPGTVAPIGWDLHTVTGATPVDYTISGSWAAGSMLDVTLDWLRHVTRTDEGDGVMDASDIFTASPLSNLDLTVLLNGAPVAKSMSTVDNVEYLHFALPTDGTITVEVDGLTYANPASPSEQYGLAWSVVPEPAALILALLGFSVFIVLALNKRAWNRANHVQPRP